ncbi:MAG: hypothetical protein A2161_13605 [Candidatus Schekmanbacteria bacterium RBG_13_48_7]|uniref:Polymerase/histidinol phosphatase N-terminal domain-containing protein n=1 Tax=Candidatus Schekmanbacteria bacterium RBG_13_48_7 TaxID=1817878 RepID=A0A1F7RM23_9BACT|nr:MAG: hypothetical protein A2161_13605 [Candidatus Schekmanbacteria bacterium RBG_13_48_7]
MNLHNHSIFSDGKYPVNSLIQQGINSGVKLLGICDHAGTMKTSSLAFPSISRYRRIVRNIAKHFTSKIRVLVGIELDSSINRTPELHNLPYDEINKLDYILFEYISNPNWNGLNLQQMGYIKRKLGIPLGLAHPDLSFLCNDLSIDQVLDILENNSIFIELSARNPSKYRNFPEFFKKLHKRNINISLGTDTHNCLEDIGSILDPINFVKEMDLQDHLISRFFL